VTIDENRITHVDGKPFFLIGARHMPEGGTPELLRDTGFNAYRTLAFGHENSEAEEVPRDLEGICFWSYIYEGICFWSYIYNRADFTKSPDHERELREKVRRLKEHPALLCYENLNEPTLLYKSGRFKAEPDDLAAGTALLRELDPNHPIWLAHSCANTVETLRRFNGCLDVVGANPYPIYVPGMRRHIGVRSDGKMLDCPDQSIHSVGRYTEKMMKVANGGQAVWMLIQAMANERWFSPDHTPEMAGQGIDESKILYPTYRQMRFMVFDAIVHGATGIALSMWNTPTGGAVWRDIRRLVGELKGMHDALCAPPVTEPVGIEYADLGFTVWDGVRVLARRLAKELYLFAVNTQFDPAEVTLRMRSLEGATRAVVVDEDREVAVENGSLSDRFEPCGTHVYRTDVSP